MNTGEKKQRDVDDIIVELDFLATDFFWAVCCSDGKLIMEKFQEYFDWLGDSRMIHNRVVGDAMQIIGYFQRECDNIVPSEEKEGAKKMVRYLYEKLTEYASDGVEQIEAGKHPIPTKENEEETRAWIAEDFRKWEEQFQN